MMKTIKDAIIQSLEELGKPSTSIEVCDHILANKYYEFTGKTPQNTISAQLGDFLRNGDSRFKRRKGTGGSFAYYLSKNESDLDYEEIEEIGDLESKPTEKKSDRTKQFEERDLHLLLSTYLETIGIYSKTIFHERSKYGNDNNQIWTHPDIVGVNILSLKNQTTKSLIKSINRGDLFKLSSFEIKKDLNNDSDLKKAFFQAVSNSSWANYGYLVAFDINSSLFDEMERLNQSFGIGIVELKANPYRSRILFQARYNNLDYKTIDKLCSMNKEFEKFIEQIEKLATAEERFYNATKRELIDACDRILKNETEVEIYCKEKSIPYDPFNIHIVS